MDLTIYMIHDSATGEYSRGGWRWGKRGKWYREPSHVKLSLQEHIKSILSRARRYGELTRDDYEKIHNDKSVAYALLPETWDIVIVENGKETRVKARDFWNYKKS